MTRKIELPPHVYCVEKRPGRLRYRFIKKGAPSRWLPDPWTPEFVAAYRDALARSAEGKDKTPRHPPGSVGELVLRYLKSGEFSQKASKTQREYRRVLEELAARHGEKPVARLERRHVRFMRDAKADTPAAANAFVRVLRLLLTFAVEEGYRKDNPARGIKPFRTGEWRAWTDEECAAFEARWPLGTMQRRAYALALYTGQRRGDLIAMQRQQRSNGWITVRQQKTGEMIEIPEHGALTEALRCGETPSMMLIATPRGTPFAERRFSTFVAEAMEAAGLPDDLVWHGLRKTAARRLAEAGCTEHEIQAITGHATAQMVAHYTRAARRRRLAEAAIHKLHVNADRTSDD